MQEDDFGSVRPLHLKACHEKLHLIWMTNIVAIPGDKFVYTLLFIFKLKEKIFEIVFSQRRFGLVPVNIRYIYEILSAVINSCLYSFLVSSGDENG